MALLDQDKRAIDVYVGTRVAQRRFALKLTTDDVASRLGLLPDELTAIEMGSTTVTASILVDLCGLLRVKPSWFFKGFNSH